MRTIYKYPIYNDIVKLEIPTLIEHDVEVSFKQQVVHVELQQGVPCLWVLIDTKARIAIRAIETFGTGYPIAENFLSKDFLGTVQKGDYVWHLFYNAKESYNAGGC